jgi:hypothetical protein
MSANKKHKAAAQVVTTHELDNSRAPWKWGSASVEQGHPAVVFTNRGPMVLTWHGRTSKRHWPRVRLNQTGSIKLVEVPSGRVRGEDGLCIRAWCLCDSMEVAAKVAARLALAETATAAAKARGNKRLREE